MRRHRNETKMLGTVLVHRHGNGVSTGTAAASANRRAVAAQLVLYEESLSASIDLGLVMTAAGKGYPPPSPPFDTC